MAEDADEQGLGEFRCYRCDNPIVEGQHYIRVAFALDTAGMGYILREPSLIAGAEFDTLHCAMVGVPDFVQHCIKDERVRDTFDPIHG